MTISTHIAVRQLNDALSLFERCADEAPEGTFEEAKEVAELIAEAVNDLMEGLRSRGLLADNCDGIRLVEAVIYGYMKDSNPDATVFATAEGFGAALGGPARERVLAQAVRDRDFLRAHSRSNAA